MTDRLHRVRRRAELWVLFNWRRAQRWLRYRLRLVRQLEPLPELVPRPDPLFSRAQIAAGRLAGRLYARMQRIRERLRIQRARLPERTTNIRLGRELAVLQRGLLGTLFLLIALGTAGDVLLARYGDALVSHLPYSTTLRDHLTAPTESTLALVLTATAAATGTILGLVLTISLIVFQTTATRYDSDRIVSFLLRERVGAFVVRLIGLAFLLSLWVLALRNVVGGFDPYVSTALALVLGTTGIASLLPYRSHALAGYLPPQIFRSLARELRNELGRLLREAPGPSVEAHARQVAAEDLGTIDDLLHGLITRREWRGVRAGIDELRGFLVAYLQMKRFLPAGSQWFERVPVRLGDEAFDIAQNIARRGLLPPSDMRPDSTWVEKAIIESLTTVAGSEALADRRLVDSLLETYANALQLAWRNHDFRVVDALLAQLRELGEREEVLGAHSQGYLEVLWAFIHDAAGGLISSPEEIVGAKPWKLAPGSAELPQFAREQADILGRKIRKEIRITGRIVTPRDVMEREVGRVWQPYEEEKRRIYLDTAFAIAQNHLHNAVERQAADGVQAAAEMTLRLILMAVDRGGRPAIDARRFKEDLCRAYELIPTSEGRRQLREDSLYTALRVLAERQEWPLAVALLSVSVFVALIGLQATPSPSEDQRLVMMYELLFHCAYLYAWGEFHQHDVTPLVAPMLSAVFNVYELAKLYDTSRPARLPINLIASVRYITWFQPLRMTIYQLPDRWEHAGLGYGPIGKEHPSPLFAEWHDFHGHDDVIAHLVTRISGDAVRRHIIDLIDRRIRTLAQSET